MRTEGINMCNHDYTKDNHTLVCLPLLRMVHPMKYQLQCTECHKRFCIEQSQIKDFKKFLHMFFGETRSS